MIRVRTLFTIAIPSMFIGGLLFGNHFGHAAAGDRDQIGYWPAASDSGGVNASRNRAALPPVPPTPPAPPMPPTMPSHGRHGGISVSIHGNKVKITGIDDFVAGHLEAIRQLLRDNPNIPRDVRDKILARMDRVKSVVDRRLRNLDTTDLDQLGEQMEKMGEELEQAMQGLDEDLAKLDKDFAKDFGKDFEKAFGKDFAKDVAKKIPKDVWASNDDDDNDADDDDKDAVPMAPDVGVDADDSDLRDALGDIKDMALKPSQKDAIVKLRTDSDARVAAAKQQLDDASRRLETALGNPQTSDADIARYVDEISGHEAAIRKARLLAWVNARRVLDDSQIQRIEQAAKTAGKNKTR
jgi:hypothetical protein